MPEQQPEEREIDHLMAILGGFILGLIAGGFVSVGGIALFGSMFGQAGKTGWIVANLLDLVVLALCGYWALHRMKPSGFRNGLVTGLSIAFILSAACGVTMLGMR